MKMPAPIILSVLLQGRNDSYMGNFLQRLSTCINKHADNIVRLGAEQQVELALTDWGSVEPLSGALRLSEQARHLLKIVYVRPETAAKFNADSPYSWVHAVNTGARRCRGEFILFCDSDGYFPLESFQKLLNGITQGAIEQYAVAESFFVGSRYHIPASFHVTAPTLEAIDEFVRNHHGSFDHDKVDLGFFAGNAASYLWSKKIWEESRGFDEKFIHWGWYDIDLFIRLAARYRAADLEDLGIPTYHLEHYSDRSTRVSQTELSRKWNVSAAPARYRANGENWGLRNEAVEIINGIVEDQNSSCSGSEITPSDELYFGLQKLVRLIYLMMVAIGRDPGTREKMMDRFTQLSRTKGEIVTVTSDWFARTRRLNEPGVANEINDLLQRGQEVALKTFKDDRFQAAWHRMEKR